MKRPLLSIVLLALAALAASFNPQPSAEEIISPHLKEPVEIFQDPWGVSHIYAGNEADLFFAQGYSAARDRLFQLEVWRRLATGTVSEVLGEKALDQDVGARLLRFRGDLSEELRHYHPRGPEIIGAFVQGINAYVDTVEKNPSLLPLEFRLLGLKPGRWTPEVVISRHNGLFRNASVEMRLSRLAVQLGLDKLSGLLSLEPGPHTLKVPEGLNLAELDESALKLYQASRAGFSPGPEDILDPAWRARETTQTALSFKPQRWQNLADLGSNNWAIGPDRSITGYPFLANDPHRSLQVPSLRYFAHLVAPGWNVIGGGEPALPGISIGHNQHGAWGLTIFAVDQEDLYVYETNPQDPQSYRYRGGWEKMRVFEDVIEVKDQPAEKVKLLFTRHGPVIHQDAAHQKAYALRAAWLEEGTSPYLASLRFNQSRSWPEFQAACSFFLAPSENMIWADRQGNIGWQATGITPIRPNWDGLFPVPGDGRFEWDGFLPTSQLPHSFNPPEGFVATANQLNLPRGYPFTVGLQWSEPFRYARLREFLGAQKLFSMADMKKLQQEFVSLPARWLIPLVAVQESSDPGVQEAIQILSTWNHDLQPDSVAAAIYMAWERELIQRTWSLRLPEEAEDNIGRKTLRKAIDWLSAPNAAFGPNPTTARDQLLLESLSAALLDLKARFGPNVDDWAWGNAKLHHTSIEHLLAPALEDTRREILDIGPVARGGSAASVNMTNNTDNQTSGATFRVIIDLGDWDRSLATNMPGQSGDPESPHYRDLVPMWASGQYFPLLYSRAKVESAAEARTVMKPGE